MITAIVQFKVPQTLDLESAERIFLETAPKYKGLKGLIRKYYLLSENGKTAGGVYLWNSKAEAEALYTDDWKKFIKGKYGSEPSIVYFESPVLVDNLTGEIIRNG